MESVHEINSKIFIELYSFCMNHSDLRITTEVQVIETINEKKLRNQKFNFLILNINVMQKSSKNLVFFASICV